jgi:glycosyltransferase involved in cell wall biosynthesis
MSQHILYLTHYYLPEVNAPAVRVSQFAREWTKRGQRVTVLTGFPNHPSGIIPPEYRGKLYQRETVDGIDVRRSYVYAAPNKGFARRVINYLSFMISATLTAIFTTRKVDLVIATSPQFFVAVAGYVVSRLKRVPFIFEVRDLWPEEIVAVGAMKRGLIISVLERLELFLYRKAALIVAVAQGTIDDLTARGVPPNKLVLIPNGVDFDHFALARDTHEIRDQHNLNGHFLVSYIGTHGMAHNLGTVLDAADRLRAYPDIQFLFVGDGAERQSLIDRARQRSLHNVVFVPQQPRQRIADYYAASDVCLVPLRRADLFTKNIPSKIYEVMAAGKPIVIGADGESRRLVESAQAGVAVAPDNAEDLSEKIFTLAHDRDEARRLGANGRAYARDHCRHATLAERYLEALASVNRGKAK